MQPVSAQQSAQDIANARAQGQQLQNQYNQQAAQAQGQYQNTYNQAQQDRAQANAAQAALSGYNVQGGGQLYNQYLTQAQQQYGFDPRALAGAQKQLLASQTAMQYAPQAAQQAGNYYGATAGQASQAYQNMAQNLNTTLANQTNKVNTFQNLLNATQAQAQAQTGAETTTQGQKITQLTAGAQNATQLFNASTAQMTAAEKTMNDIETLQQNQGYATAQQVAAYQNAYSNYLSAKAAQVAAQGSLLQGQGAVMQGQAAQTQANYVAYQQQLLKNYVSSVQAYFGYDPNKGAKGGLTGAQLNNYNDFIGRLNQVSSTAPNKTAPGK